MDITLISVGYSQDEYEVGMGLGPAALMEAGLAGRLKQRGVRVAAEVSAPVDLGAGERMERLGRLGEAVAGLVREAVERDTLPVVLGGDCLNGVSVAAGLRHVWGEREFGVAWFDAHGDFNTEETTLSGYLPGMPLAAVCGRGLAWLREAVGLNRPVDENQVVMLGVRDLDPPEKDLLDSTPISYLSPDEVRSGRTAVAAGHHFKDVEGVYLHIDIDALDPEIAPGVNYLTPGGLSFENTLSACRAVLEAAPLAALTLAAVNPPKDVEGKTVEMGVRLLVEILAGLG